jgi:ABC-2 type transport system permease protein
MNIEFLTFLRREIYRFMVLYKQTIVPALLSSLLYILVFGETLGNKIPKEYFATSYMSFIVPGLAMMSVITQSYQNSASSIMQAKYLRFIEDILIAPLSGLQISLGYIIGGAMRGLICGWAILVMCIIMPNTDFNVDNWFLTMLYLLTVSWTFSAFGVIIGVIAKSWDEIGSFSNFIFMPMTFLGGVFYSLEMLPNWAQNISLINPIYWMISGLRYSTLSIEEISNVTSLIICLSFSTLFTIIASYLFKTGYKIKS